VSGEQTGGEWAVSRPVGSGQKAGQALLTAHCPPVSQGIVHPGKNVFATILLVWPLLALRPGRK
jgi:hypothetical protein